MAVCFVANQHNVAINVKWEEMLGLHNILNHSCHCNSLHMQNCNNKGLLGCNILKDAFTVPWMFPKTCLMGNSFVFPFSLKPLSKSKCNKWPSESNKLSELICV